MNNSWILFVSPIASHPVHQGNAARLVSMAELFRAQGFKIALVYYGMEGFSDARESAMRQFWDDLFFIRSTPLGPMSLISEWGIDDWCPDLLVDTVAVLAKSGRYRAVLVNYVWMSRVLEGVNGPTKIIDTHDVFGDRKSKLIQQGLDPRWYFTTEQEEAKGLNRADIVIAIQNDEEAYFSRVTRSLVITVGYKIEPHFLNSPRTKFERRWTFGYIGSANPLNIRSLELVSQFISSDTAQTVLIAGSIVASDPAPSAQLFRFGYVSSLEEFYGRCDVVINPMVGGTGLKIKTVEALSYGKAVIGTVDAFVGIPTLHDFHRIKNMHDFGDAIGQVARSQSLQKALSQSSIRIYAKYTSQVDNNFRKLVRAI